MIPRRPWWLPRRGFSAARRATLLGGGGALGGLLAGEAKADTPFTTFKFPSTASVGVSGVTNRSDPDRWSDVINVLDFGADPTGLNTSDVAIQAAINVAGSKTSTQGPGGGVVFIPAGTYKITNTLVPLGSSKACIAVIGAGWGTTLFGSFKGFVFDCSPYGNGAINISRVSDMNINNGQLSVGADDTLGCIRCTATQHVVLANLQLVGWNGVVAETVTSGTQPPIGAAPFWCILENILYYSPSNATSLASSGVNFGGTVGFLGLMQCCCINCDALGGFCGFWITGTSSTVSLLHCRTEAANYGIIAGYNLTGGNGLSHAVTVMNYETERCDNAVGLNNVSTSYFCSLELTGTRGRANWLSVNGTEHNAQWGVDGPNIATITYDTSTGSFGQSTLDQLGWHAGQTRQVIIESVSSTGPGTFNTSPNYVTATYKSPNSFTYPLATNPGTYSPTPNVGDWSLAINCGIYVYGAQGLVIESVGLSLSNLATAGIDLYQYGYGQHTACAMIGVQGAGSWAMPPTLTNSKSGFASKASWDYIQCDQPGGSTLDAAGHTSGMVFADLPGQTNVKRSPAVEGMEYDILDSQVGCPGFNAFGGGNFNVRVRYTNGNWNVIHGVRTQITFAQRNTSPAIGEQYNISDSSTNTWGAPVSGGGTLPVLMRWNGTNWTVVGG